MSADTGLCALSHFYFNCSACLKIALENAETSRSYLNDCVCAVLIEVLVKSALACVVVNSKLLSRPRKAFVGILAD